MSEQYKVVNPTSLFSGRVGKVVSRGKEIKLVFDGPRGDIFASFHPSEIKKLETKDAWVLRLKDKTKKENHMLGEWFFDNENEDNDFLTMDTNVATLYFDKEKGIEDFKRYEQAMIDRFGNHAICNFGYTNMMKNFEFVEVEVTEVE